MVLYLRQWRRFGLLEGEAARCSRTMTVYLFPTKEGASFARRDPLAITRETGRVEEKARDWVAKRESCEDGLQSAMIDGG